MGLFRTKDKAQPDRAISNYRQPIQGNRKLSWDKSSHGRRPSDLDFDLRRQPVGALSDVTRNQNHAHVLQISSIDQPPDAVGRRRSHQTDTTSRVRDSEARMIRVRKSDVFSSKPKLRYHNTPHYETMPDGHLPTLRGQPKSAFVDQLADELDTHQLRGALDTDSRRRKRRQSARESRRLQSREISTKTIQETPTKMRATMDTASPVSSHWQYVETTNASVDDVETIIVQPVTTGRSLPQSGMSTNPGSRNIVIPGSSEGWQDGDACIVAPPLSKVEVLEPEVLLAGNRQSFPDFAVVDRRDLVRQSSGSGFLTTAWSSLWRRASTARTKKENDVAQHRTNTLEKVNNSPGSEKNVETPPHPHIPQPLPVTQAVNDRPLSASSSVLYETLDDLPQSSIMPTKATPFSYTPTHAALDDEVPTDAFYDPSIVSRAGSRAAHSRNFSRPTNDSSQGRYSRMSIQHPVTSTKLESQEKPFFSPLLSGGAFPRPEKRQLSNSFREIAANERSHTNLPKTPPRSDREEFSPSDGFSTPALAAGIGRMAVMSSTDPQTPVSQDDTHHHLPSTTLTYQQDAVTPPTKIESRLLPSSRSLRSLQSLDSEGSWLINPKSELDNVVRRSFSRNDKGSGASINSGIRSPLKRPVSAGSTLRAIVTSDDSDTEPSLCSNHGSERRGSETDEHLDSPLDQELEDDAEYEQGIWRTGIGKPVQVVTSPLRGNAGPVIIDRFQLGQTDHISRRNSDEAQLSHRASIAGELDDTNEQQDTASRPTQLMQHESYMTSMNSFHTANVFSTSQSAASSRATLTEAHYQ